MLQASVVEIFEILKQMNLISKEDVLEHGLIPIAAKHGRFDILEWLTELCHSSIFF